MRFFVRGLQGQWNPHHCYFVVRVFVIEYAEIGTEIGDKPRMKTAALSRNKPLTIDNDIGLTAEASTFPLDHQKCNVQLVVVGNVKII